MALDLCQNFSFRSISIMNRIGPYFIDTFILTRSRLGLLPNIFRKLVTELLPLIYVNFVLAQNLQSKWIEFRQILYMHLY